MTSHPSWMRRRLLGVPWEGLSIRTALTEAWVPSKAKESPSSLNSFRERKGESVKDVKWCSLLRDTMSHLVTNVSRQLNKVVFDGDVPASGHILSSAANVADFPD